MSPVQWYPAPGKLNLLLHVLGRRADGYHELQTVFRLIDRSDRIGIAVRDDGVLRRLDALPGVAPEDDLCLRAAAQLAFLLDCGSQDSPQNSAWQSGEPTENWNRAICASNLSR